MQTQLESGREMGWVTLGHTFSCGHIIKILDNARYMLLVIYNPTIILNLFVCLFVCSETTTSWLGLNGSNSQGSCGSPWGHFNSLVKSSLSSNSSQTIGPKGLNFSRFSEDLVQKILSVVLYFFFYFLVVITNLGLSKSPHSLQTTII